MTAHDLGYKWKGGVLVYKMAGDVSVASDSRCRWSLWTFWVKSVHDNEQSELFFTVWLLAAWKLSPMVGTVYGPEVYAGKSAQNHLLNTTPNVIPFLLYFVYVVLTGHLSPLDRH